MHAIPTANQLAAAKKRQEDDPSTGFDIYIIATAFEDFEYNTKEATLKLLQSRELVGEARKQLGPTARHIPPPNLPVAYDIVTNKCDMSPPDLEAAICAAKDNAREQLVRSQSTSSMPPGALEQLLDTIDPTSTLLPEKIAATFWSVRGAGTPMWVIHRRSSGEVLDRRFGQSTVEDILLWMRPHLKK